MILDNSCSYPRVTGWWCRTFPLYFLPLGPLSLSCLIIYFMQLSCVIPWAGSWSTPFLESFKSLWNILKHSTPFLCNLQRQLSFHSKTLLSPSPVLEIELAARVKSFPTKFEINKEFSFHSFNFIGLLYIIRRSILGSVCPMSLSEIWKSTERTAWRFKLERWRLSALDNLWTGQTDRQRLPLLELLTEPKINIGQ